MEKFTSKGWKIAEGSKSGHCCFEWSIVDEFGNSVCEGWSEHASIIAEAPEMYQATKDANRALRKIIETMELMEGELISEHLKLICRMDIQAMKAMTLNNDDILAKARGEL